MLLSPFTSPRRLAVLIVFVFLGIVALVRNSQYSDYLPDYDAPSFRGDGDKHDDVAYQGDNAEHDAPPFHADQGHHDSSSGQMWQEYKPGQDEHHRPVDNEYEELPPPPPPPPPAAEEHKELPPVVIAAPDAENHPSGLVGSAAAPIQSTTATSPSHAITPIAHLSWDELQKKIKDFIQWERPDSPGHWPGFGDYVNKDYDPNRWEGLPMDTGYYADNGIHQLEDAGLNATSYLPYPDYKSQQYRKEWLGEYDACKGPRGLTLDKSPDDIMTAWPRLPKNFPNISVGAADVLGLDAHSCFDRESRYAPYKPDGRNAPEWETIYWGQLQNECLARNKERYDTHARKHMQLKPSRTMPHESSTEEKTESSPGAKYHHRTAILIRTWEGYTYTENDLEAIRALVTETSLLSGGEYQVYLLVNVKEREADIYDNPEVYQSILHRVVPHELRDISVLWTEAVCEEWYPKVGDWQVYWMQFMPLQWFSKTHPEFDYIWNWETDARYTGNHYHFLEQIAAFAKSIPRKHLWERNTRFYLPEQHGDWESYLADTDAEIEKAVKTASMTPVWGAQPYASTQIPLGPTPPTRQEDDKYTWGVDEEADLITLQPIWDPNQTEWSYRHKIWNFIPGIRPIFTPENGAAEGFYHEGFDAIPRRVFINTLARFSKKMLHAMHTENLAGRSMQAEMWPATVALQHGLKAVYAPHPIWSSHLWPPWYADAIFNADAGKPARWGQEFDSPYNHDREVNFKTWSWYYATDFPKILFWRWLGWEAEDRGLGKWGGKDAEDKGVSLQGLGTVGGKGKMCLPGMLLHPVKKVFKDDDAEQ